MDENNSRHLDNPAKSSPQARKKPLRRVLMEKKEKKDKVSVRYGVVITVLLGVGSLVFIGFLFSLNVFPVKYVLIAAAVLLILFLITYLTQHYRKLHVLGKTVGVVTCAVMILLSYALISADHAIGRAAGNGKDGSAVSLSSGAFNAYVYDGESHMILTVNHENRQILMTKIPEDYYMMMIGVKKGKGDILKQAVKLGDSVVLQSLGSLYETEIPFYVKTSSGFKQLLSGLTPDMAFRPDKTARFVEKNISTNLSKTQLRQLIKILITKSGGWKVFKITAKGANAGNYTYSQPDKMTFVLEPDRNQVAKIANLMDMLEAGDTLTQSDIDAPAPDTDKKEDGEKEDDENPDEVSPDENEDSQPDDSQSPDSQTPADANGANGAGDTNGAQTETPPAGEAAPAT